MNTNNYDDKVLNHPDLTPRIKEVLLKSFLKYSLDVGEKFIEFDTMSELQQYRDVGLGAFIVDKDEKKTLLTLDQEMALMELELLIDDESDYGSIPDLIDCNSDSECDSLPDLIDCDSAPQAEDYPPVIKQYFQARDSGDKEAQREAALKWIQNMDSFEFQERLLDGQLPEFEREDYYDNPPPLERTCHASFKLMTDEEHQNEDYNQGFLKRHKLRYDSVEYFKNIYYEEFRNNEEQVEGAK
jgi:hypothetical protein